MVAIKPSLFEQIGGLPVLEQVHTLFYDKVYAHEWLGQFFIGHDQASIERRQTLFMAEKMGGDVDYWGKLPEMAHRHLYITHELFDLRHQLLSDALHEAGVAENLIECWLAIDNAFVPVVVKDSIESFYRHSFHYQKRIIVPKPVSTNG
jgi:truncated hemoglobin YjbI